MRKLLIGLGAIVAMVAIVCGLVFFAPWFAVKSIDVRGAEHASVEEIQQASGVMVGEQLVSVDAPSAARQVVALPWVKTATVSKKWPSTVSVAVIEQQAVAYVKTAEGTTLVNADGVPFVIDEAPLGTVEISGASVDDPAVFSACLAVVGALPEGAEGGCSRAGPKPVRNHPGASRRSQCLLGVGRADAQQGGCYRTGVGSSGRALQCLEPAACNRRLAPHREPKPASTSRRAGITIHHKP